MFTQPQPIFICDTVSERDTLSPEEGVRCFCKDTSRMYIYLDTVWKPTTPEIFSGLSKITVGTSAPSLPSSGDLWIDTN